MIIALSINKPSAIIIPVIDVWCSGKPITLQPNNTKKMANGIVVPTMIADLSPKSK